MGTCKLINKNRSEVHQFSVDIICQGPRLLSLRTSLAERSSYRFELENDGRAAGAYSRNLKADAINIVGGIHSFIPPNKGRSTSF